MIPSHFCRITLIFAFAPLYDIPLILPIRLRLMCNLFRGWTVGPIHSSTSVSLHIKRSAHCCSNENNDPLLAFQGFAISSFFFGEGVDLNKQLLFLSDLIGNVSCLFLQRWQTGSAHNIVLCYCGSWTPDALEYAGFPSVMRWVYIPCSAALVPL